MDYLDRCNMVLVPLWHCSSSAVGYRRSGHNSFWLTGYPKGAIINT